VDQASGPPAQASRSVRPPRPVTVQRRQHVHGVEAGGADQHVERALAAVGGDDALRRDALDGRR
jgi:hypothetical protein